MGFITRAFDLFYKRLGPTGSNNASVAYQGYLPQFWFTSSISSSNALHVSQAFYNFPHDSGSYLYVTTRDTGSKTYRALPWGSMACDMLWNVTVPSWSYYESESLQSDYYNPSNTKTIHDLIWTVNTATSKSFFKSYFPGGSNGYGVASYNVTSSWKIIDSKFITGSSASASFFYVDKEQSQFAYPSYVGGRFDEIRPDASNTVAYDVTWPTESENSTSSFDNRYFDLGGGAGITRNEVSASMATVEFWKLSGTSTGAQNITRALKARRLYFPTPYTSSGATSGTDYWFKLLTGYKVNSIFSDNGGIYNVQMTIKRSLQHDYYPDTGSFLSVFIHNVIPTVGSNMTLRVPGADGWYPPENNIVRITNAFDGGPELTFYDIQTGYLVEKFNFNVVQYGTPAQLCIEPSGSVITNAYFGIIIDDIQICKIGVTTDPRFLKPATISQRISFTRETLTSTRGSSLDRG